MSKFSSNSPFVELTHQAKGAVEISAVTRISSEKIATNIALATPGEYSTTYSMKNEKSKITQ
uniref:Uncharacterized protein n=1 Tax=Romanomermis culicivorax TaxID=13658 RepID=A0A915IU70_ROMCU